MYKKLRMLLCVSVGVLAMLGGAWLLNYRSAQVDLYNQAMEALDRHDLPATLKLLDASSAAYKAESNRGWLGKLVLPAPRKEIEARAHFHRGVVLVQMNKGKEAIKAFWDSLRVNPGNRYIGLTSEEAALWYDDALQAKANIEKLYRMGQGDGRAKGKQGRQGQPGQPGEKRDPNQGPPGSQPGKKGRDTL
jgi:tetratricopeptide (TPR) repeat protein